jgi:hypothetical protein
VEAPAPRAPSKKNKWHWGADDHEPDREQPEMAVDGNTTVTPHYRHHTLAHQYTHTHTLTHTQAHVHTYRYS